MTASNPRDRAKRMRGAAVNAAAWALRHESVPADTRELVVDEVLREVAAWLTSGEITSVGAAAVVAHDVEDCAHLPAQDCYDDRAARAYTAAADLIRPRTEARP